MIHWLRDTVPIKLWLSRKASVPIREQLGAQLLLGILSRKLAPGERLPSVREMARRLRIHANTVSAVYRDLTAQGWLTHRRGSGVFVAQKGDVSAFARACMAEGLARGFSRQELQAAFSEVPAPRRLVVIDPDVELARVLAAEIGEALGVSVGAEAVAHGERDGDTCVLINSARVAEVLACVRAVNYRAIELKSMQEFIEGHHQPSGPVLIGVLSRSQAVLHWAVTLLSALGFEKDGMVLRRSPCIDGLRACDIVACDVVAAADVPDELNPLVFRIVSKTFLDELRNVTAQ